MAERREINILNEGIPVALDAKNRSGKDVQPLTEDDRTIRVWDVNVLRRTSGGATEVVALAETNGSPRVVLYGKDASENQDALRTNADLQLQVQVVGADEGSNNDAVRTDPDRILWTRPYAGWVQQDGVAVPVAEGIVYNPGTTAAQSYWVQYKVVNIDAGAAAVTVSVGVDVAAGGSLAGPEYDMFNEVIPYPGSSGWRDLGIIAGDDDIRAVASVADDAIIRFKIRRIDTGA